MSFWTSIVLAIVSLVYSVASSIEASRKAKAAQRAAAERADAAKGFQIPVEAQAKALPVYFGRNLIGGVRVYHNTLNTYNFAAAASGGVVFDAGNNMGYTITGTKHEFLIIQQALSCGEISRIVNIDVDQMPYNTVEYQLGARFHVYGKGGTADPLMTANDAARSNSRFTGVSFLTAVFRLNRDNPQYAGVPVVQVFGEGTTVENVALSSGVYTIASSTSYSNNPARCLLHYLLNPVYGKGLAASSLNLKSFYDAIKICERVVVSNANKDGRFWSNITDKNRDIKIYECNMAIDTAKKIRDNIEEILLTMPGSELIWSNGVYSLSLNCPYVYKSGTYAKDDTVQLSDGRVFRSVVDNNTDTSLLVTANSAYWIPDYIEITDDQILNGNIETAQPNAQTRLNAATITYANESKDFTEDTVTWPDKANYTLPYNLYLGSWDSNRVYQKGDIIYYSGVYYQLRTGINRKSSVTPDVDTSFWAVCATPSQVLDKGVWSAVKAYTKGDIVYYNGVNYQLADGVVRVNSTVPSSDTAWVVKSNLVYTELLADDSQMSLETTEYGTGIVSYYNALAAAEQKVRESRSNVVYKFSVTRNLLELLPGSLIYLKSNLLNIPGEMLRVNALSVQKTGDIDVTSTKFDANTFAWNVSDNEVVKPRNVFDITLAPPTLLQMDLVSKRVFPETIATLTFNPSLDIRVSSYLVKYTTTPLASINESTTWITIGRTTVGAIEIPFLNGLNVVFAVIPETVNGRIENYTKWSKLPYDTSTISFANISGTGYTIESDGILLKINKAYSNLSLAYEIRKGSVWDTAQFVATISGDTFKVPFLPTGSTTFLVKAKTREETYSATTNSVVVTINTPGAVAITSQVIDNNVLLYWTNSVSNQPIETYEVRKALTSLGGTYGVSQLIGNKSGLFTSVFETQSDIYDYWITPIDAGGNYGVPAKSTVRVAQPPDYNMVRNTLSTFNSTATQFVTKTNCASAEVLIIPANASETVAAHMATYTSADAAIAAGNVYMVQSVPSTAEYKEILDFGAGFENNAAVIKVAMTMTIDKLIAGCSYQVYVSKSTDNITYSAELLSDSIYATAFRYIKFRLVATSDTKGFLSIASIKYTADTKLKAESGVKLDCLASDTGGSVVNLSSNFYDIASIDVTASGTTPILAMYDFVDAPNPTSFKILLFNPTTGARVNGAASWNVKGY